MYESEAKMAKAMHACECAPNSPRESVEMKLSVVGDRICTATALIRDSMNMVFGVNPNEERVPTDTHGLYGLADALDRDSRALLAAAEELRKRCGG